MRLTGTIIAVLCIVVGAVWSLQGLNLLGGSFMTGQREWLAIGLVVALVGLGLLVWVHRGRPAG